MTHSTVLSFGVFTARALLGSRTTGPSPPRRCSGSVAAPAGFTLPGGHTVQIPKTAVGGPIEMLEAVAAGDTATVVRTRREVTTQQAAGCSTCPGRPWSA
jgi:hypothetical protein